MRIANYELEIANYELEIRNYELGIFANAEILICVNLCNLWTKSVDKSADFHYTKIE